ncbi:MAG: dihydrofolate reductase [Chloroflexota bacterium]
MASCIAFVVAMDQQGVIGVNGRIPWHLPDDMKWFREVTMGKPVIMGRKTYESIPARFRPLPGRHNIVITRQPDYDAPGATVVHTIQEALAAAGDVQEIVIGGGGVLYEALLPQANRLYLTLVDGTFPATPFPSLRSCTMAGNISANPRSRRAPRLSVFLLILARQNPKWNVDGRFIAYNCVVMTTTILTHKPRYLTNIVQPNLRTWSNSRAVIPISIHSIWHDCTSELEFLKIDHHDGYLFIVVHLPRWDSQERISPQRSRHCWQKGILASHADFEAAQ